MFYTQIQNHIKTGLIRTTMTQKIDFPKSVAKYRWKRMLFFGKNLAQFVFMFETQSYREIEVRNEGSRDCYKT